MNPVTDTASLQHSPEYESGVAALHECEDRGQQRLPCLSYLCRNTWVERLMPVPQGECEVIQMVSPAAFAPCAL